MGIKHFWKDWLSKIPASVKKLPPYVTSLFIDVNGMFYQSVYKVLPDAKQGQEKLFDELSSKTEEERIFLIAEQFLMDLEDILRLVKPSEYLILAVDGVAPMAKITQQRKRRFLEKTGFNDPDTHEDDRPSKTEKNPASLLDTRCITPGTRFMQLMDAYIKVYINNALKSRNNLFPTNVIYSSYLTPGEGEHKIFEHIRAGQVKPESAGANVVWGLDSDLVMLSLLSDLPYLYLYQERTDNKGRTNPYILNVDMLRDYIHKDLNIISEEFKQIPMKTTTRDFVVMIYLVGNDFLPNIVAFDEVGISITRMMSTYQRLLSPLTDDKGVLIWENMLKFINALSKKELKILEDTATKDFKYPFTILDKSSKKTFAEIDEGTFGNTMNKKVTATVNFPKFQDLWYKNALEPKTEAGKKFMKKFKLEGVPFTKHGVLDIGYQYLLGLQWILHYYQNGTKASSSRFVYTYHYAPLLTDLTVSLEYFIEKKNVPSIEAVKSSTMDPNINAIHQLICVMPPKAWKFIPEPFRALMSTRFADISPIKYKIEKEGIKTDKDLYTALSILSIVDPIRIVKDIEDYNIPKEYLSQMPFFIKNVKRVNVPQKFLTFEAINRAEQKRLEYEASFNSIKETPHLPLDDMKSKIKSIKTRVESKKEENEDNQQRRKNVLFWKKVPLM